MTLTISTGQQRRDKPIPVFSVPLFSLCETKQKGSCQEQEPFLLTLIPSPELPGSGSMGMFSDQLN